MNLTPVDVEQKAFTQALRGYQMDEVDDFLDEVVGTLRNYEQRLREAHDKIRVLESESSQASRGGDESEIARAILTAQRSADRVVAEARAEAESIRAEAVAETSQLAAERDNERARLEEEVANMANLVAALRSKVAELSTAVSSHVAEMEHEIASARGGLGGEHTAEPGERAELDEDPDEHEDLDDFDEMQAADEVDRALPDDETPSFSDIFPEPEVDLSEEQPPRVSARPWERG